MVLPTVDETLAHRAYEDAVWKFDPVRQGKLSVADGRGGPFNIAWEVHGSGPILVVVRTLIPSPDLADDLI